MAIILLVAMALNTTVMTREEAAAMAPTPFDPAKTGADLLKRAETDLTYRPLAEVVAGIHSDVAGTAGRMGAIKPFDTTYIFPVSFEGQVSEVAPTSATVTVAQVPPQTRVQVATGTAVNGAPARDALGYKFSDAPGQTEYQYVSDEIKKLVQQRLSQAATDPGQLQGKTIRVRGMLSVPGASNTVPVAKPLIVQVVALEVVR
ncbi:DUF2291 family protein [Tsukamurella asaccharolytica]|uniref:DUF2291 family protein n=1 Tax=Tsukamurella asaccharolytica TaxID=2592067 RepID=UPI001315A5B1|nr:DUF2291 family protein [Tsukamurella asaccharolytica]